MTSVTVPLPVPPLGPSTVTPVRDWFRNQLHVGGAVTAIVRAPPAAGMVKSAGDTSMAPLQPLPSRSTWTERKSFPDRSVTTSKLAMWVAAGAGSTVTVTWPGPLPEAGDTAPMTPVPAMACAVQAHPGTA